MCDALRHRGPDDGGIWVDPQIGLAMGHRRLAILDLSSAGRQPMVSSSKRYCLVFNGEIYNHLAIRAELESKGLHEGWRGHSDTETLLVALDAWGLERTVTRLVGMFAFALWDSERRVLHLARDRVGEKPLYYGWHGDRFFFASELKALRQHENFAPKISQAAVAQYLRFGYIPAPLSIYEGVQKLLPGTTVSVDLNKGAADKPKEYWSFKNALTRGLAKPFDGTPRESVAELKNVLMEAIRLQQVSDVPLGAFLSGGVDSSAVVALMQTSIAEPVHTFTLGFADANYDEAVHARRVAEHLGTNHTEIYVTPSDVKSLIPQLSSIYDEPFADSSQLPTMLVCKLARRSVTVAISGDGGDELFGGYNRYLWARKILSYPLWFRRLAASGMSVVPARAMNSIYSRMCGAIPSRFRYQMFGDRVHKLASVLNLESAAEVYRGLVSTWRDPAEVLTCEAEQDQFLSQWDAIEPSISIEEHMMLLDAQTYLVDDILCKVDRAAMSVSLETRVPILDHRVIEFAASLPLHLKIRDGESKWVLRQLLYEYVPKELIERPKMGFGIPIDTWLRTDLREWADGLLTKASIERSGLLRYEPIRKKWDEHCSGERNWQYPLWNILMLQSWLAASFGKAM